MSAHINDTPLVLLVDDDVLLLEVLAGTLRAGGMRVSLASSGTQALARLAHEEPPNLVVLDITMPDMSGLDLAARLGETPYMFVSANDAPEIVENAARGGAVGFLRKPIEPLQLLPAVRAALARAAEIRTLRNEEMRLAQALREARETGIAIGLLMERHRLDQHSALKQLRDQARASHRRLHEVAQALLRAEETLNCWQHSSRK